MSRTLYMETTKIEVKQTVTEIMQYLTAAGATGCWMENDPITRKPTTLGFRAVVGDRQWDFLLPSRIDPILKHIQKKRPPNHRDRNKEKDREQAERVAWRQILLWIKAQFALINTGMADLGEVFLPYVQVGIGETFYQKLAAGGFKSLPEGRG